MLGAPSTELGGVRGLGGGTGGGGGGRGGGGRGGGGCAGGGRVGGARANPLAGALALLALVKGRLEAALDLEVVMVEEGGTSSVLGGPERGPRQSFRAAQADEVGAA